MRLVDKKSFLYVEPERAPEKLKVRFISRQLGLPPKEGEEFGPVNPAEMHLVQQLSAQFSVKPRNFIFMNQVHSDLIIVKTNMKPSFPTADAVISDQPNLALCVKSADCTPVFLYDVRHRIIAAVHAGWRGTALKIVRKTLKKMEHFFKTDINDVHAFVGPAIGACCYEVGKEVVEHFHFLGKARQEFFGRLKNGKFMMDIKGINARIIENEGVPLEQIEVCDLCTSCRADLFHSHRRDKETAGRNINFIEMLA